MRLITKNTNGSDIGKLDLTNNNCIFRAIPASISNSMVLWYDIERQKATNESMATNPILKDLSGNGHDAECFNFAWSGMSGIGGYKLSLTEFFRMDSGDFLSSSRYECNTAEGNPFMLYTNGSKGHPAFRVKVSGLSQPLKYMYSPSADSETTATFNIPSDGEYEIPQSYANSNISTVGFLGRQAGLVIELVPLYPGALVSDGVDDYAVVENAPILYNGKGFTIIAKREILQSINERPLSAIIADNRLETLDGAFLFEGLWYSTTALLNFGRPIYNRIFPELYSYMTSVEYNGEEILKGQIEHGSEKYTIFACDINNIIYPLSVALYSLLLFDRDLTTEEIEWVKTNLLGEKKSEFNEAFVDGWIFNGTNNNFPNTIKGINDHEMVLYGFDGTTESGFNNGLQFDGVDDYTKVSGLPLLTDFTVICRRQIYSNTAYIIASKAEQWNTGAFILEDYSTSNGGGRCFGTLTGHMAPPLEDTIVYMTSSYYKNNPDSQLNFTAGTSLDTEFLWLGIVRDGAQVTSPINIKYILLYNRTLTEEEIQQEIEKAESKFNIE